MVVIKIEYLKLGRCSELLKIGRYVVQDTVLQKGGIISLHLFTFTQDNKGTNNNWENDGVKKYIGKRAKIRWNKYLVISIFPEAGHFEEGNSLNLAVTAVVRHKIAGNSAQLPSDVLYFAMLPSQRFWRETVSFNIRCHVSSKQSMKARAVG